MPGAVIAFDQVRPSGTSYGTPGVARDDLWLTQRVLLRCATSGATTFEWVLLASPPGSTAAIQNDTLSDAYIDPDIAGSYRVQLTTDGGGPGNVQVLVFAVRYDNAGVLINRGWRIPAAGELPAETNFNGNTDGWTDPLNVILADLMQTADVVDGLLSGVTRSVVLTETATIGDWVCTASDPTNESKVKKAVTAALATSPGIAGVMLQAGNNGDTRNIAVVGDLVAASTVGLTPIDTISSFGSAPPTITLSGTASLVYDLRVESQTGGARGTWTLRWSTDGGATWPASQSGIVSAATVPLTGTGLTLNIATGTASTNNYWTASNSADVVLVQSTARAVRAIPAATDYLLGKADPQGNLTIAVSPPGTVSATQADRSWVVAADGRSFRARAAEVLNFNDYNPVPNDGSASAQAANSAAFAQMIADKDASGGSKDCFIPPNRYSFDTSLSLGTKGFILRGAGYHYYNQGAFGQSNWISTPSIVTGSVLAFPGATHGIQNALASAHVRMEDFAVIGSGTVGTTGIYNSAAGGVASFHVKHVLVANFDRGIDLGGAEESSTYECQVMGCIVGVPVEGTPQWAAQTNSSHYNLNAQFCTIGTLIRNCTGVQFSGSGTLFQTCGKTLSITGVTNATPVVVQVSSTTGLVDGQLGSISGVTGTTSANGEDIYLKVVDATHVSLYAIDGVTPIAGNGAYTGGGTLDVGGGALIQPAIFIQPVVPGGSSPPAVTITGTPKVQNQTILIEITTPGTLGVALFRWSINGVVQATGQTTASSFTLGTTGLVANFPAGTYSANNTFSATSIGGTVNIGGISDAWFENNSNHSVYFDTSRPGTGITGFTLAKCHFGGGASGDLGTRAIAFATAGAGSSASYITLLGNKANSLDLVIPAAGAYGRSSDNVLASFTNNDPGGWSDVDHVRGAQFPSVTANGAVRGQYFGPSGTVATAGSVRLPGGNQTHLASKNNAGTQDIPIITQDNVDDLVFGSTVFTASVFLKGKTAAYLGNATVANAFMVAGTKTQTALPIHGGDGTAGVPNSAYAVHGSATTNLGDSDQSVPSSQYSRERCEFTDTFTANRVRTFPTPANADGYYEKTVVNSTSGGFSVIVSCGGGATIAVPPATTMRLGFKSTGDVVTATGLISGSSTTFVASGAISKGQAVVSANNAGNRLLVKAATTSNVGVTGVVLGIALATVSDGSNVDVALNGAVVDSSVHLVTTGVSAGNKTLAILNQTSGFAQSAFNRHPDDYQIGILSSDLSTMTIVITPPTGEASIFRLLDPKYGYNGLDRDLPAVFNELMRKHAQNSAVFEIAAKDALYDTQVRCRWDEMWIDKTDNHAIDGIFRPMVWGVKVTARSAKSVGSYGLTIYDELNDFGSTTGDNNCGKQASILEVSGGTVRISIPQADIWPKYATNTTYNADDMIEPATANDYVYRCFVGGTTGATASGSVSWPTTVDATVQLGSAFFRCEPKRPKFPIDPKEWEDHFIWFERAATWAHNARWLVVKVLKDGSDGNAVELLCAPNGASSGVGSWAGIIVGNDTNNGAIAWRLMRSLFQVRSRANVFENITIYKKQGYYSSFDFYCTQGTYYGLSVITDLTWRYVALDGYPVSSYKASYSMAGYEREVGNYTTTYRVRGTLANKAYAFPICPQPGHYSFRAENETSGASTYAANTFYNVGEIVRPTTATGLWWECDRAGTTAIGATQPAAMGSAGIGWGYSIDEGAGKPRWHAVYAGAASSTTQTAWQANTPVTVNTVRRFGTQTVNGGGGYNLRCIQAGTTGASEPVIYANGKANYTIFDVITDGLPGTAAKWRLEWNAGTGKIYSPLNCDYFRDYHVFASQSKMFVVMDSGAGQSREHAWYDCNIGIMDFGMTAGHQHVWAGGGRYTNEYAAYGGVIWHGGDAAMSTRVFLLGGNGLYLNLRNLYSESNGGWIEFGGPGSTITITGCRFTTDNSRLHRSRDFIASASSSDVSITDTTIQCTTGTVRYCMTQGDSASHDPMRIKTHNFRTTETVDLGYPARTRATYPGPWPIANNSTLTVHNTLGTYGTYDASSGSWTVTLKQLPALAGNTLYAVGELAVNPGAWGPFQFRCITGGTTAVGTVSFSATVLGQRFTSGGAAFVAEWTTQPQNLLEWHAWEVAACINRDASYDFKVLYAYQVNDIIVPWEIWRPVQYRVTNVTANTPYPAFGAEGTAPGRSGTARPSFSAANQVVGATIVSGGITMVCEPLTVPAVWSYADMAERVWIESRVSGGSTEQRSIDVLANLLGSVNMGVSGGTANPTLLFGDGLVLYPPKELDVLTRGLFVQAPAANQGSSRSPRLVDIDAFVYGDDNTGTASRNIRVYSVQQAEGSDQSPDYAWLRPAQHTSTLVSATRTPLNNSGGTVEFKDSSPYASWPFPADFEWNTDYDVELTLVGRSSTGSSSGPSYVGPPLWTPLIGGILFTRAVAPGTGNTESWSFRLVRHKKGRKTVQVADGSVTSGGTTLTTSSSSLGTTRWTGGTLRILSGASKGDYLIASTTNTTVTISGATFPATESGLSFVVLSSSIWTDALLSNGAQVVGRYDNPDLAAITSSAQWSSAGGVGWVNRAQAPVVLGTLFQNTGASAPTVAQDTDGVWYVDFDGSKYIKQAAALGTPLSTPLTFIFLLKFTSTDNAYQTLVDGYNNQCRIYNHPDIRTISTDFGTLVAVSTYPAGTDSDYWVLVLRVDNTRLSNPFRRTRFQLNNGAHTYATADTGSNAFDGLTVGATRAGASFAKVRVCAIKIVSGDLTKADEARLTHSLMGVKGVGATRPFRGDYVSVTEFGADDTGVAACDVAVAQAQAAAASLGKTLLYPAGGSFKLTVPITHTVPCEVRGLITGSTTVAFSNRLVAARQQIFASTLSVTFSDYSEGPDEIYPEWFGAKGDGVLFQGSITSGTPNLTSSTSVFTPAMVGLRAAVYTAGTSLVHNTTIASYTSGTAVTLTANAGSTFTSQTAVVGTDDRNAIVAALVASRGLRFVSFAPEKVYCVYSSVPLGSGTGRGWKVKGNRSTLQALNSFTDGILTNDPGSNTSTNTTNAVLRDITLDGSNLASDGLYLANRSYPNKAAGCVGTFEHVSVRNVLVNPIYAHACQESDWTDIRTSYTGSGVVLLACNAASVDHMTIASVYGSAKDALVIDAWPNQSALTAGTFTADASTDVITHAGKLYPNELKVQLTTTGTLPAPLATATDYWVVRTGSPGASTTSRLATSRANAQAGVYVDITTAGTGTHTITPQDVSGANSYGGGDVFIRALTTEIVTGRFVTVKDENGSSGTVVHIESMHGEGGGLDGIWIDRPNTVLQAVSMSGPGSGSYYPVHLSKNAHGTRVRGVVAASYTSLATLVDAGCLNADVGPTFSATTKSWVDPVYSGGWSPKDQRKRATGDLALAGQLGIGTLSPRERVDIALGGVNVGRGTMVLDHGQARVPWGGVGQGQNLFDYSRDYSKSFWTGGKGTSCTMTNNVEVAPDGTTTAALQACWGSTATQRFQWAQGDIYTYLGFTDIENGDTTNGVNYVHSVYLKAAGSDESGSAYVADASGGSATVLLDTTLGTGVSVGDGKPFGFVSMGVAVGDPVLNKTERVVAWVVSVDSEQQLTLTSFGIHIDTGVMTAVSSWNSDTYVPPQRCQLWLTNGNGTSIASKNIMVDWAWRSYDVGGNTVAYPADNTKKPRAGVFYHSTGQYPYAVHRWEDQLEIVATGAPLRPGPVVHTEGLPFATKRPGATLNAHPTNNPAYGQQVFLLKLAIDFNKADAAVLYTVPADVRGLMIHRAWWETGTAWTGGTSSAIGVSSDDTNYNTKGDILGGAAGDVAATLTGNKFTGGTIGAKFGSNGVVVVATGKVIRFDRITSAFTAGTGYVWLECSILP